jgi:hypothetical protein
MARLRDAIVYRLTEGSGFVPREFDTADGIPWNTAARLRRDDPTS